jgi:hypothetical protein
MKNRIYLLAGLLLMAGSLYARPAITFYGSPANNLYELFTAHGIEVDLCDDLGEAIARAPRGTGLVITAVGYPDKREHITSEQYYKITSKKLRVYLEYPDHIPGKDLPPAPYQGKFDRGVVTSGVFGASLPEMSVMTVNGCHIIPVVEAEALMVYAKVAGFDKAEYGLTDTDVYPLLYMCNDNTMIALSSLSNYKRARFGPNMSWKSVWEYICGWLLNDKVVFSTWTSDPRPMYTADEPLPANARKIAVERGTEWLYKGIFFMHPSWKALSLERQGESDDPSGPPLPRDFPVGDGCLGILEGHQSYIYYDGSTKYRYWRRCDVQGEVSYLLASSYDLLNNSKYKDYSEKLMDFMFYESEYRQGAHNDKNSPVYGLLGWGDKANWVFYSDDNARAVLGAIGASALMDNERWNMQIVENILANFRTASRQGFHGERLHEGDIINNGWRHYSDRDYTFVNMNFECYCWALYLWLYEKTGYRPLLDKARSAIKITMDAYPDNWHFMQGIQSEKGRFLLPLSWLVRVEDTAEHRGWLDRVMQDILKDQDPCGAVIEFLGDAGTGGSAGRTKSNASYGTAESPINFRNTDKVADMLYTCNFMLLGFNEAYHATGNRQYKEALDKLGDFLLRIQVKSDAHPDIDGAWFRAFDYGRWDYWAENADAGWGAWSTLTGWIQSWIVGTQALMEKNSSFWDITKDMDVKEQFQESLWMLE